VAALPLPSLQPQPADSAAARRGGELSAELHAAANERPWIAHRAPPQLKRDSDGTCHYEGEAIAATILPDGGVAFEDKPPQVTRRDGVAEPPERPVTLEDVHAEQRLEVSFKLRGRAWQAEREWFLRETAALRRELADQNLRRELVVAERALRAQAERIWCDGSRSAEQRRAALFELWDETSADELGALGRAVVLDYVRRNLPPHGRDAFPAEQLALLNARRSQRAPFDPYGGAPDAGL
jgi:hypothetical protein